MVNDTQIKLNRLLTHCSVGVLSNNHR